MPTEVPDGHVAVKAYIAAPTSTKFLG